MDIQLNEDQQQAFDKITKGKERVILLLGSAGTGKTTLVKEIVKYYGKRILVTATTHKAKTLLISSGVSASTVHSALGFVMVRSGLSEALSNVKDAEQSEVLVVDEYSMLPKQVFDKILKQSYKKIILVGDPCQLPAIGMRAEVLPELEITLTKQMRQSPNVSLNTFFNDIREAINNKRFIDIQTYKVDNISFYESHNKFCEAYNQCTSPKRILAYSNRVVDSYNLHINNRVAIKAGDLVVLDKPIGGMKNGDIAIVQRVSPSDRYGASSVMITDEAYSEKHKVVMFNTKTEEMSFLQQVIEECPNDFHTYKSQIVHLKQLYSSTVHKAQGQSIDEVFIDLTDIKSQLYRTPSKFNNWNKPIDIPTYMRLVYVAISRMKTKAHIFIGDTRNYKLLNIKDN